jgi:hypothetical protein
MTLKELFLSAGENQNYTIAFFTIIPVLAVLIGLIGGTKDHLSPWKYFYTALVYLVSIPGIFAVAFNVYLFLFQRRDIMETELLIQVLPVISMLLTIFILKKNINLEYIPGFDKIYALWMILFATMSIMWFLERVQIIVFSFLPFQYLLLAFLGLFAIMYFGWRKFTKS